MRTEAAHALGNIGASEGISPLCRMLLEDPDPQVREAAAESLGLIADESSVTVLKAGLADLNYSTRLRSMEALEKMGKNAIPFFLDALTDSSEARVQAASALERMGVVAQKIEELDGPQERKSFDCLRLIAKTGVVEALIRSLNHPRFRVRVALCRILAEATHPRTFEGLIHVVEKDKEWAVRLEALSALVKLGDFRSLPLFIKIIQNHDEEEMIRLHLLTLFINAPRSLLEQLWKSVLQLLNDVNLEMRKRAVQILSRLPLSELTPALLESLTDPAWEVRREAALALGKHEQESTDV